MGTRDTNEPDVREHPMTSKHFFWTVVRAALLASVCLWPPNAATAQTAEAVFDTLLTCKVDFFDTLRASKSALGGVVITPHPDPNASVSKPRSTRVNGIVATLKTPVSLHGLTATEYTQVALTNDGKTGTYWWGFRMSDAPDVIATAVKARMPTAELRQRGSAWGWVHELDTKWRKDPYGSAIEHQAPLRMLLIEPSRMADNSGSTIRCGVVARLMEPLTALPDAADLFGHN
jgi:hypothetical protein